VALFIGLAIATWLFVREGRARRRAIEAQAAEAKARTGSRATEAKSGGSTEQMQIQKAEELFAADDSARAVAQLASVLTVDRSNRVAAERLLSALTYRSFSPPSMALLPLTNG